MKDDKQVSLVQHLDELRKRVFICIISIFATSALSYSFVKKLLPFIAKPVGKLVFIQPLEAFLTYIKLAILCGVLISLPIILYQVWAFVSVGLRQNERRYIMFFGPFSLIFFLLGAVFAYTLVVPSGLKFLMGFASDYLEPMLSVSKYISFIGVLCIAFGISFEMPIVFMFLTKIGLVNTKTLKRNRRIAIAIIFICSAILTPPDVFTQIMMAVPLIGLYEISIFLSYLTKKGRL